MNRWFYGKHRRFLPLFRVTLSASVMLWAGCADHLAKTDRIAADYKLEKRHLIGRGFTHLAYYSRGRNHGSTLHVYLSGDGSPWIGGTRIATDPTPRNPVTLRLMSMDPDPSLFLGRPCYHGLAQSSACDPSKWTSGRYSEAVVASMAEALQGFVNQNGYENVVLIGYSGGGVLAWLIAERAGNAKALVTIAANLDIDAWTELHGYTPLHDSLNPATRGPLPSQIRQLHVVGERDTNVPPSLVRAALNDVDDPPGDNVDPRTTLAVKFASHRCCWEALWPDILEDIRHMSIMWAKET
ncbi:alpha/beta fold hydrolase [Thiocapsa bogorovii]|uniref:alpha/beta fold hydrolase n=1 Tax=Thiocapsa bogorovii TaxID=521689 RepID=UPI001E6399EA|nr:alpha/beta hydrolase [Thiocapsa bogorovii]UHD16091.1 alpha/beta hydrolase [Thiocapsa bogorovii]